MSAADTVSTSGKAKKRFDIALIFAICGVLFSLLIFLFMFKQERDAAIQIFQVKVAQDVASFEQQLTQNLYSVDSLQAYLYSSGQVSEAGFRNAAQSIARRAGALGGLVWLNGAEPIRVAVGGNELLTSDAFSSEAPIASFFERLATRAEASATSAAFMLKDQPYLLVSSTANEQGRIVLLVDLSQVMQKSLLKDADEGVAVKLFTASDEGVMSLFSLDRGQVTEDAIFDSQIDLLPETGLTLNFAATDSYLSDKMNYTSIMFLVTGLLLSYLMASYLKRIGNHLNTLREEQEVLSEQMIDTSWHDPLTGLVNRVHFDEALDVECRRAVREFSPLTMILLRIDGFKAYVDHYGFDAADVLLQRVSETLKSSVGRPGDMIARLDDNLFGFILPSTNELVVQLAERCCVSVRELDIPQESEVEGRVVTLSIGVATLQPTRLLTGDRLFDVANEQLTEAVGEGGDRYSAYAESGLEPSVTYSV